MNFNVKYFLASILLSSLAGTAYHLNTWLIYHARSFYLDYATWLWFLLEAAKLFFGVFLPFALMYVLTVRGNDKAIRPLLISTFLGCWIGQLVIGGIDKYLTVIFSRFFDLFYLSLASVWEIFASMFSITLFVSLTAILLTLLLKRKSASPTLTRSHSES